MGCTIEAVETASAEPKSNKWRLAASARMAILDQESNVLSGDGEVLGKVHYSA